VRERLKWGREAKEGGRAGGGTRERGRQGRWEQGAEGGSGRGRQRAEEGDECLQVTSLQARSRGQEGAGEELRGLPGPEAWTAGPGGWGSWEDEERTTRGTTSTKGQGDATASTEVEPEEQGAEEVLSEPELGEGQMS
jgi:hypothetical protein